MIFHLVMEIQILMKVVKQIELPDPILSLADNPKVLVKLAVQASPQGQKSDEWVNSCKCACRPSSSDKKYHST